MTHFVLPTALGWALPSSPTAPLYALDDIWKWDLSSIGQLPPPPPPDSTSAK